MMATMPAAMPATRAVVGRRQDHAGDARNRDRTADVGSRLSALRSARAEQGQGCEYGLIAAGIALAIISAANGVGTALKAKFGVISTSLK